MACCLVHNPRYRGLFHGVVNELRHENRTPSLVLRNMPRKCCTCADVDQLTLTTVLIDDREQLKNFEKLYRQIKGDKPTDSKLVLAFNQLENFIKENRGPVPRPPTKDIRTSKVRRRHSNSESDDDEPMEIETPLFQKAKKPPKPLKAGTFIFLPYKFQEQPQPGSEYTAAKRLHCGRFIGRHKYIEKLEEQYHVRINMITLKTTEQTKLTLENAKAGTGNVTIRNKEEFVGDGEWVLVREKKNKDQTDTIDFEALFNELQNRWNGFFQVQTRKRRSDEVAEAEEEHPAKQ